MKKRMLCLALALVLLLGLTTTALANTTTAPGAVTIDKDNQVYLGFAQQPNEGVFFLMTGDPDPTTNRRHFSYDYNPLQPTEGYLPHQPFLIRACKSEGQGSYSEYKNLTWQVQKIWIEVLDGDNDTFSFSSNSLQTELIPSDSLASVQLYAKCKEAYGRLWAEVAIDGQETVTISSRIQMKPITVENYSGENESGLTLTEAADALNTIKGKPNGPTVYRVMLKPGKHSGTLTLPEGLTGKMVYIDGAENGSTTIEGGIDLNGSILTAISNISFAAPSGTETKAIYGGSCMSVENCSFYNYDTALDSTEKGLVNPGVGNLFVNNGTAIKLDISQVDTVAYTPCSGNTFINNETAVKVVSLHSVVSPFLFRITNSNFINNGLDFDVEHPGTYYFYKNYFGAYDKDTGNPKPGKTDSGKNNGKNELVLNNVLQARSLNSLEKLIATRPAKTDAADGVRIITNPRWAYPVAKWWHKDPMDEPAVFGENTLVNDPPVATLSEDEEYVNYLTSDWDGTEIVNAEADGLLMDAAAFSASDTKKTIDVVAVTETNGKTSTETLGTWSFE